MNFNKTETLEIYNKNIFGIEYNEFLTKNIGDIFMNREEMNLEVEIIHKQYAEKMKKNK